MYYAPWWLLLACLPIAALAAFLRLRRTGISRRNLYVLTVALSPVILLGAAVVAVVVSTSLSVVLEPTAQTPTQPVRTGPASPEPTSPEPTNPTTTFEVTVPETTSPSASPAASPSASPAASPSASPAPDG